MSVCVRGSCKIGNTLFAFEVSELANNLLFCSTKKHAFRRIVTSGKFFEMVENIILLLISILLSFLPTVCLCQSRALVSLMLEEVRTVEFCNLEFSITVLLGSCATNLQVHALSALSPWIVIFPVTDRCPLINKLEINLIL